MNQAERLARKWLTEAVAAQAVDLTTRWVASQDAEERERIHAEITATIKLEDSINARIEKHAGG